MLLDCENPSQSSLTRALQALQREDYGEAAEAFATAISDPAGGLEVEDRALGLGWSGTFEYLCGNMDGAAACYEEAIRLSTGNTDNLVKLALVHLEAGRYVEMTELLERAAQQDPKNPAILFHRGEIFAVSGNLHGAVDDFTQAILLEPSFWQAYVHKTRAMLGLGMIEPAQAFASAALDLAPNNCDLRNCLGEVLVIAGKLEEAGRLIDDAIAGDPMNPYFRLNKALLLQSQKRLPEVEVHLREAIRVDPSFVPGHMQLAIHLMSGGTNAEDERKAEAMRHFDITVRHARTLQELIMVHSQKAAIEAQSTVISIYPMLADKLK